MDSYPSSATPSGAEPAAPSPSHKTPLASEPHAAVSPFAATTYPTFSNSSNSGGGDASDSDGSWLGADKRQAPAASTVAPAAPISPYPTTSYTAPQSSSAASAASHVSPLSSTGGVARGITLPPQVDALVTRIRSGADASTLPIVRSRLAKALSWQDPVQTAGLVAGAITLYLAHTWLTFTLPSLALTLLVWALIATGLLHAAAPYAPAAADIAARIRVPIDEGAVDALFQAGAVSVRSTVAAVNGWLSWINASRSLHALAWAWIATRFTFLLTPGWGVFALLAAVAALPAYLLNVRAVDALVAGTVVPRAADASRQAGDLVAHVKRQADTNGPVVLGAVVAVPLLLVYLTWDAVALSTWATLFSLVPVTYDTLAGVAGLTSSTGKRE